DIYKAPYLTNQDDQVKILRGRKASNVTKADIYQRDNQPAFAAPWPPRCRQSNWQSCPGMAPANVCNQSGSAH
ncbi:MAG: hypothetical protein WCH84_04715, partial [Verrucomicrobiota bacterium]